MTDNDEEWEKYCKEMVVKDDKWWESWLGWVNQHMKEQEIERQRLLSLIPETSYPEPKPTEEEKEENRKSLNHTKCLGCDENYHDSRLDGNLLCETCVKKGSDHPSEIKLGNPESAFFFQRFGYSDEIVVAKDISYLKCPICNHHFNELKDTKAKVYRILFEHFVKAHYDLLDREHTQFQNLAYAILQEFSIYESGKGARHGQKAIDNRKKKCLAIHNLMKHQLLPLALLSYILKIPQNVVGGMAWDGIGHCNICSK